MLRWAGPLGICRSRVWERGALQRSLEGRDRLPRGDRSPIAVLLFFSAFPRSDLDFDKSICLAAWSDLTTAISQEESNLTEINRSENNLIGKLCKKNNSQIKNQQKLLTVVTPKKNQQHSGPASPPQQINLSRTNQSQQQIPL
jgi:hypothetical protein